MKTNFTTYIQQEQAYTPQGNAAGWSIGSETAWNMNVEEWCTRYRLQILLMFLSEVEEHINNLLCDFGINNLACYWKSL